MKDTDAKPRVKAMPPLGFVRIGTEAFACLMLALALASAAPAADRVVGFRGDGSGHFAGAGPATRFSEQENLRWKANVGQGCGAAVIVDQRLFVQAAPNALVCLDKSSGKELWRRTHHAGELDPKSVAAQLDMAMEAVGVYHDIAQRFSAARQDEARRTELQAELEKQQACLPKDALRLIPGAGNGQYRNGGIYTICTTPCSDGRSIVAAFPTGIVVAYDLDGKWMWSSDVRPPTEAPKGCVRRNWRPIPSVLSTCPLFTAEGIVVAVYGSCIYGLEARGGKVLWRGLVSGSHASPVAGRIGNNTYVASGDGYIFRVRDGHRVYADPTPGVMDSPPTPLFGDGVFYWVSHAVRVTDGEEPRAQVLWDLAGPTLAKLTGWGVSEQARTGPGDMTSAVLQSGHLLHYNQRQEIVALDQRSGREVAERRPTRVRVKPLSGGVTRNWAYGGLVLAGKHLIVIHDNGVVKVMSAAPSDGPAAANPLPDDVYGQPTCEGPSLYIRSVNSLWRFDNPEANGGNP